jgi:hypothetical protein
LFVHLNQLIIHQIFFVHQKNLFLLKEFTLLSLSFLLMAPDPI